MRQIKAREFWPIFAYPTILLVTSVIGLLVYVVSRMLGSEDGCFYGMALFITPLIVIAGLLSVVLMIFMIGMIARLLSGKGKPGRGLRDAPRGRGG